MILDRGICTVFRREDNSSAGDMPRGVYSVLHTSWYGELSFETSPVRPTEGRRENRTDARVRVLQCRDVRQNDVAVLRQVADWGQVTAEDTVYRITRAYHGLDDDGPTPVTDLSLEVMQP